MNIIYAIFVDFKIFFTDDKAYEKEIKKRLQKYLKMASKYDNIIAYLVMNEPHAKCMENYGLENTYKKFNLLKKWVKEIDKNTPVSYSTCLMGDYIDMSMWDFVSLNNYIHYPSTVIGIGYKGYNQKVVERYYPLPVIITEFGLSVSEVGWGDHPKYKYGANSLEVQAEGDIQMYEELIQAGCTGGCAFQYCDGWWKTGDGDVWKHESMPEEWFGIVGIDDEDTPLEGISRPAYYEYQKYNTAILIEPKEKIYPVNEALIEIFCDKINDYDIETYLNDEKVEIIQEGTWWLKGNVGNLKSDENTFKMIVKKGGKVIKEEIRTLFYKEGYKEPEIKYTIDKKEVIEGEKIKIKIHEIDKNEDFKVTLYAPQSWKEYFSKDNEYKEVKAGQVIEIPTDNFKGMTTITLSHHDYLDYRSGIIDWVNIKRTDEAYYTKMIKANSLKKEEILGFEFKENSDINKMIAIELNDAAELYKRVKFDDKTSGNSSLELMFLPGYINSWYVCQIKFDKPLDFSDVKYFSIMIKEDKSGNEFKLLLVDEDKEQYYKPDKRLKGNGWQEYFFASSWPDLCRDPYDGVRNGNGKNDLDKTAALSIVFGTKGNKVKKSIILLDEFSVYR